MGDEKKRKDRPGGVHAGHRARMRQRFMTTGLDSFQDHEVLEFLLYYAIPRRDVNETAHLLLNHFGTLTGVLDAPPEELCTIPGVGPGTAHFLSLIPQITVQMARQTQQAVPFDLSAPKNVQELLDTRMRVPLTTGQVLLALTSRTCKLLSLFRYDSFEKLTAREIAMQTTSVGAELCVIIEKVPDCTDFALPGRLEALNVLSEKLKAQTTPLRDYYTVDDLGHTPRSYARSGQLLP